MMRTFWVCSWLTLHIGCWGVSSVMLRHLIIKSDYFEIMEQYFPILAYWCEYSLRVWREKYRESTHSFCLAIPCRIAAKKNLHSAYVGTFLPCDSSQKWNLFYSCWFLGKMGVLFTISIGLNNFFPQYMTSTPTGFDLSLPIFIVIIYYGQLNACVYSYDDFLHVQNQTTKIHFKKFIPAGQFSSLPLFNWVRTHLCTVYGYADLLDTSAWSKTIIIHFKK